MPSKNLFNNSPKNVALIPSVRASQKMGECLSLTGNFSLLPGGSDPILPLPLCDHWVFNKGPFQKNELEECKHGGDG